MANIQSTSESNGAPTTNPTTQVSPSTGGSGNPDSFPEQRHAGKVGYGPNYHAGPSLEDKISGLKEEIEGKLMHHPDRVQHGREIYSGEEKRKKLTGEDEPNPFENAKNDDSQHPNKSKDNSVNEKNKKHGGSIQLPTDSTATSPNSHSAPSTQSATQAQRNLGSEINPNPKAKATPSGMAVEQGHGPGAKGQAATEVDNVKHTDALN